MLVPSKITGQYFFEIFVWAVVYIVTARVGQLLAIPPGNVTPVWIPSGIMLAAVLLRGVYIWPGILIGALVGNVWAYINYESFTIIIKAFLSGTANGLGDVLSAAGAGYLLQKKTNTSFPFLKGSDFICFLLLGVLAGPAISALFGVSSLCMLGFLPWENWLYTLLTWWTGDGVGVLIIAPVILAWFSDEKLPSTPFSKLELFAFCSFITLVIFYSSFSTNQHFHVSLYIIVPILIWSSFRFGHKITFCSILMIALILIISTSLRMGYFYQTDLNLSLIELQSFCASMSIAIIGLISINSESLTYQKNLRSSQEQLTLQKRLLNRSQEVAHFGSWYLDIKKDVLIWSDENYRVFGRSKEKFKGTYKAFLDTVHPGDREMVDKTYTNAIKNNLPYECIHRIIRDDGEVRIVHEKSEEVVDEKGETIHSFGFTHDITERVQGEELLKQAHERLERRVEERTSELRKTHEMLLHSEKLSAVGKLTASIAHEFNNPLYGIQNVIQSIKRHVPLSGQYPELVDLALSECKRIQHLIRSLQDFNKPSSELKEKVNVHKLIDDMLLMVQKEYINSAITLKKDYAENLPEIEAVSDQLKQVVLNLLTKAKDAVEKRANRIVTVTTEKLGSQVAIRISDTGSGIAQEHVKHIFEPFFTTKPVVKGTGLGLSVSYGIIKAHGGDILLESNPGKGTTFSIILPIDENADVQ